MDTAAPPRSKVLQPSGWPCPKGYSNGVMASGQYIVTAGLVGWDKDGKLKSGFAEQLRQTLQNMVEILHEGGASPEHIVRMTWFILDRQQYIDSLREIGAVYREIIGRNYPAMSVVQVSGLVEPDALLEIEATAVVPEK